MPMLDVDIEEPPQRQTSTLGPSLVSLADQPLTIEVTAENVLKALAPTCSPAVYARLAREKIVTAVDLACLENSDLRELGLSMLERGRILKWLKKAVEGNSLTPRPETCRSNLSFSRFDFSRPLSYVDRDPLDPAFHGPLVLGHGFQRQNSVDKTIMELMTEDVDGEGLDEFQQRAEFWCKIVQETGAAAQLRRDVMQAAARLQDDCSNADIGDVRENLLEKLFDVSPERLKEVYDIIDRDSDGRILKEELREGLHRCELHGLDGALERVLDAVSSARRRPAVDSIVSRPSLKLVEFQMVLTRLKLAQLLCLSESDLCALSARLLIVDYNFTSVKLTSKCPRDFFFGHRAREFKMRWVHMRSFDLTLLLALTVKYQLHPLSVEDVIEQSPTKIDRYGAHYFAAMELLCLRGVGRSEEPVYVIGRHVTLFCAGPPNLDTVLTISQPDRTFHKDWPGDICMGSLSLNAADAWVDKLLKRLQAVRSRVRERQSDFLLYEIVDLCTDELVRVTNAFSGRLNWLEERLHKDFLTTEERKEQWFHEVGLIPLQLAVVKRRLRGMQRILRRLHDDPDLCGVLSGYIQDVVDHLNEAYEDAGHLGEKCNTLISTYEHAEDRLHERQHQHAMHMQTLADEKMNRMLFVLTVLTTIFTPLTFFAGIYGMNFQGENGKPSIPELLWPHGYLYFWVITIVYLAFAASCAYRLWLRITANQRNAQHVQLEQRRVNFGMRSLLGEYSSHGANEELAP